MRIMLDPRRFVKSRDASFQAFNKPERGSDANRHQLWPADFVQTHLQASHAPGLWPGTRGLCSFALASASVAAFAACSAFSFSLMACFNASLASRADCSALARAFCIWVRRSLADLAACSAASCAA